MKNKLTHWRNQIDALDEELLQVLAKRIKVVREIGEYKKERGIAPLDQKRWQAVLESRLLKAQALRISAPFTQKLFDLIHELSLEVEAENK